MVFQVPLENEGSTVYPCGKLGFLFSLPKQIP
jgi:hypothetical protein